LEGLSFFVAVRIYPVEHDPHDQEMADGRESISFCIIFARFPETYPVANLCMLPVIQFDGGSIALEEYEVGDKGEPKYLGE